MIINLLIQNDNYKLDYKKIEKYTNSILFIVSLITTLNLYFDYNYSLNIIILKYYLLIEIFILPWYKKRYNIPSHYYYFNN